jgi:Flp pilus assembly protein TadG
MMTIILAPGRRDEGATVIEFALVAFVMFLVFWALIEFGRAFYVRNTTQHLTRCIARAAVVTLPSAHEKAKQGCLFASDGAYTWPFYHTSADRQDLTKEFKLRYYVEGAASPVDEQDISAAVYDNQPLNCVNGSNCISFVEAYYAGKNIETLGLLAVWMGQADVVALAEPQAATKMPAENMGWQP